MAVAKALLVTDDPQVSDVWCYVLKQNDIHVMVKTSLAEALEHQTSDKPNLIFIQECGGTLDGVAAIRHFIDNAPTPVLLLTSGDSRRVLDAYAAGVSECIVEPVLPSILLAKVNVWLRCVPAKSAGYLQILDFGAIKLDIAGRHLTVDGRHVPLSSAEFRLLYLLMSNPHQVVRSETLVEQVWNYPPDSEGTTLKNTVYRLRRKLESDPSQPSRIVTVTNQGYSFNP